MARTTYRLLGNSRLLDALKDEAFKFYRLRERAVVVYDTAEPPEALILDRFTGDRFDHFVNVWASQSRLDELQAEYLVSGEVNDKSSKAALELYRKAKDRRAEAETSLVKAQELEYSRAEELVKNFGRGPLVIDGKTYDPSFRGETVFYIQRQERVL